nr:hypothetical protein Iba_scaffold686CG0720 [Ipomoea batatas]
MTENSGGKLKSLFSGRELLGAFSTLSFSFLLFRECRTFTGSSFLAAFTTSLFESALAVSPALICGFSDALGEGNLIDRVKTSKAWERAIPDIMHAAGASTSIRRTMTPEKYTDVTR